MKFFKAVFCLLISFSLTCTAQQSSMSSKGQPVTDTISDSYDKILTRLEQQAVDKNTDNLGTLLGEIDFRVKTNNLADYEDGFVPHVEMEQPDISNLIDKDQIVIPKKITVIIDYPLTNEYRFTLASATGFTREQLVRAISDHYHKLYQDEEASATIKTIPVNERKTVYNRNQTNGKYRIWGHDISDLVLASVLVYKSADGTILLSLNIES
ncbi:hypothetical protein SNE25_26960 [Mucilaginibacter sabulilitoris]|uniref:Uncharacterized protein n=1 Tax=Mucilaginibacter sabulilitoris TaxID=1173583 RepID=A0ABZ0TIG5_9SPHI|nr:hypothetical protein [Mucilaginibacter sabulilitoris]WPU92969.1 hypothetical protein SNE25_26960 [Mucilaginibacter sabulilitoris]